MNEIQSCGQIALKKNAIQSEEPYFRSLEHPVNIS